MEENPTPKKARPTPSKNKNVAFVEGLAKQERERYEKTSKMSPTVQSNTNLVSIAVGTEIGNKIAIASLEESRKLNKNLISIVKKMNGMTNFDRLKKVENEREKKKPKGMFNMYKKSKTDSKRDFAKGGILGLLLGKINPLNAMKFLFGGSIAVAGSWVGFRGWESKFIKGFYQRFFKNIGVDKDGKLIGYKPSKTVSVLGNIESRIAKFFGADMGMKQNKTPEGKFAEGKTATRMPVVEKVTETISKLFNPIRKFALNLDKWVLSKGAKLMEFMGKISGVSGLFKIVGKILFPIGILFSAFDGIKAWQHSKEATPILRFIDGISAFIGDFVGAPFDLLKNVVGWGLKKIGLKSAGEWLQSWDIEGMLTKVVKSFFGFFHDLITGTERKISNHPTTMDGLASMRMQPNNGANFTRSVTNQELLGIRGDQNAFQNRVNRNTMFNSPEFGFKRFTQGNLNGIHLRTDDGISARDTVKPMLSQKQSTEWIKNLKAVKDEINELKQKTSSGSMVISDNSVRQSSSSVQTTNMMSPPASVNHHYGINN